MELSAKPIPKPEAIHETFTTLSFTPRLIAEDDTPMVSGSNGVLVRPVHPPNSSTFLAEFNPEYGNTDLLIWVQKRSSPNIRKRSSPKYIF